MSFLFIRPACHPCSARPALRHHWLAAKRSGHPFSLVCFSSGSIAYFRHAVKEFWPSFCDEDENALRSTPCAHHRCSSSLTRSHVQNRHRKARGHANPRRVRLLDEITPSAVAPFSRPVATNAFLCTRRARDPRRPPCL